MTPRIDPTDLASPSSLTTRAARTLSTTTKSTPQMQGISPRWLLRMLPWVDVPGGTYRVNRRLSHAVRDGRVGFANIGARVEVVAPTLGELPLLHGFTDEAVLAALARGFVQREHQAGDVIVTAGSPADHIVLLAHGRAHKLGPGHYGDELVLATMTDGDHVGDLGLLHADAPWKFTVKAATRCTVLALPQAALAQQVASSPALRAHVEGLVRRLGQPQDKLGQADIALSAGHHGEAELPGSFVDYELHPREYELSLAQTMVHVHTRVADLYSEPMDQTEQQLRLTIAALRERQEHELLNNREFGLLHNVDLKQRLATRNGPPTPEDMDELLCRRRGSRFFLAHPRTIAAFGRECSRRAIYPNTLVHEGTAVITWRGVPILPSDKIPIARDGTSTIVVMRTGVDEQGVIGLHQTGIPDEVEPGLSVRNNGIDERAITSYLVSLYFSAAVLVPDALGTLEDVVIDR